MTNEISGHQVGFVRLVFRIIQTGNSPFTDRFLAYVQCLDIVPQINAEFTGSHHARGLYPEAATSMYLFKHATQMDGMPMGGIILLQQIRALVDLVPHFDEKADRRLTKNNSLSYSSEFWLNKYFDKELFYALDT